MAGQASALYREYAWSCMHMGMPITISESRDSRLTPPRAPPPPFKQLLHSIMAYQKRLRKEYEEMSKRAPVGISLDPSTMEDNIDM